MAFPSNFLEEIRDRVSISEVISRSVELTRKGHEFVGLCPFHSEKTPSFTVSEEKNFYHCFGCGAHGDVIGYLMQKDGFSFPEAVERMAGEAGLDLPSSSPRQRETEMRRSGLIEIMENACQVYENQLWSPLGEPALKYLRERGLTDNTIREFRIGFASQRNKIGIALNSDGIREEALIEVGLIRRNVDRANFYDFFRNRIIFPIADSRGRIIAFGGRTMADGTPKYINSPDTPIFNKGNVIYGLHRARKAAHERGRVIVVEGFMDVIALAQAGFTETIAPLGTALTERHLTILWKLTNEPILFFDGDTAGIRAAARVSDRAFPLLEPGKSLHFASLPEGMDPDNLVNSEGASPVEALLKAATPLVELVWSLETMKGLVDTPERIAGLEKRLERRVALISDKKVQYQYRRAFRDKLKTIAVTKRDNLEFNKNKNELRNYPQNPEYAAMRTPGFVTRRLQKRLEQVLLIALINHPTMLNVFAEDIAMIKVFNPELDKLRQKILKIHADDEVVESSDLKRCIEKQGGDTILQSVFTSDALVHAAFANLDSPQDRVEEGLREILKQITEPVRRAELEDARLSYINDPTEENWEKFEKLKADGRALGDAKTI